MTTPAKQALVPVAQSDRDMARDWMREQGDLGRRPFDIADGKRDEHPIVQLLARHRQSHSLPGDVGMLVDQSWLDRRQAEPDAEVDTGAPIRQHVMPGDPADLAQIALQWYLKFDFGYPHSVRESNIAVQGFKDGYRAALTSSPCPGDGMREALKKAAIRFEVCAQMISGGHDISGTRRAEQTIKAKHFAAEALAALTPSALSGDAGEGAILDLKAGDGHSIGEPDDLWAALAKIMPIVVENGPDYATVNFGDGETHRSQTMTMNPQDWLDIQAAFEAAHQGAGE